MDWTEEELNMMKNANFNNIDDQNLSYTTINGKYHNNINNND